MRYSNTIIRCALPAALVALAGCGDRASSGPAVTVRDSAGVQTVESARPQWEDGAGWKVGADPQIEIGLVDGPPEYQLSMVRGAVRLSDGRIVIAHGDAKELRYYDSSGRFLKAAGRSGGGPGEFKGIEAVYPYRGDSVAVWDPDSRRISIFGPDGAFGRAKTIQEIDALSVYLRGVFADGSLLLEPTAPLADLVAARNGEQRDSVRYLRYTADVRLADTLGARADRERMNVRTGNLISQESILFGRDSYAVSGGDRAYLGQNDSYRIDLVSPSGAPVMSIRRSGELRRVTGEHLSRVRAAADEQRQRNSEQLAKMAGGAAPAQPKGEIPNRETIPAFDKLVPDDAGNLWVRDYMITSDDQPRWSVFDPKGRWLGTVETPRGLDVCQIGSGWILGRARDELDVEYVRLYPLNKG